MILNRNSYFRIRSCGEVDPQFWRHPTFTINDGTNIFFLRDFSDADYWLFDINHSDSFDVWAMDTLIPDNILERLDVAK